jgi:hypothetical protein
VQEGAGGDEGEEYGVGVKVARGGRGIIEREERELLED